MLSALCRQKYQKVQIVSGAIQHLECAVDGAPSQIPTLVANSMTNGLTVGPAVSNPSHEGRPCGKFGQIPLSGLEEDSVTDRWRDDGKK